MAEREAVTAPEHSYLHFRDLRSLTQKFMPVRMFGQKIPGSIRISFALAKTEYNSPLYR